MLIIDEISEDQTMSLGSFKETKEIGRGMIKNSKPLSKITFLQMKKKNMKKLIQQSIV
jgi:hypothetical protein